MAAASRRGSSRVRIAEANENDELRDVIDPIPFPHPRSPLISIPDPAQNPRGVCLTPKASHTTPARAASRFHAGNGVRERSCLKGIGEAKSLVPVEVPYFELKEDPSFWEDHNVQVLIRIRPINVSESTLHGYNRCLTQENSQTLTWTGHPESRFTFDNIACETMSQEKLFRVVGLPMVESCMSGYNGCMFAYGQTGSGKTYTMMGELRDLDNTPSNDRGMTPRIFEYLFTRIREEEECRSNEQLRYNCKCSFLEIYNEQITDLLEPSSTNLQLREDMKKGVYVENLSEHDVSSVKDVVELLLQGAANRKMAATNMNSESSRSHSVFTCVIESRWETDSMTHLRYGRLNLVDLAGSERQKSSGAEGERLKEAANINRSLSTLGLVIMTLVDVANGKNRHVPYRDSRLTFLLQDSLGGNSKTTIVANISPSICSSNETLSTLKFAQRAKLIQNNAKVNEDASGDVMALQRQVQELKDQLSFLKKHQNTSRSVCHPSSSFQPVSSGDLYNEHNSFQGGNNDAFSDLSVLQQKVNNLEVALAGSFRREKMTEAEFRMLEAEMRHMNHLMHLMEDDAQRTREMLKLRDEKIRRLELLADDLVSSDGYLMEENIALSKEIQLLREQIDRNPNMSQFALENMRLVDQLRVLQHYCEQGERETLLGEISNLRNHLLHILERKYETPNRPGTQDDEKIMELDICRRQQPACLESNIVVIRNNNLHPQLKQYQEYGQENCSGGDTCSDNHMMQDKDQQYTVRGEPSLIKRDFADGTALCGGDDRVQDVNPYRTLQLKLDDVSQNVDEKANQATSLLLKYEKSQETMEEAELILTALMKANEDAKHERDSWKQATKQSLSEKTVLIEELHQFDAFTSSALQQYKILQKQMHAHLAEVSGIACSIEESFQQIQKITMEGLDAICSDMSTFGQELISYVGNLRSIINVMSHKKERDFNFHVVHQCQLGTLLEQINYLKVNPPSLECREAESCSKSRNLKSCTRVPNIDKTEEVLEESHTDQSMLTVPLVRTDDAGNGKVKLPSKPINSPEKSVQMMNDIMDLTDDIQLLEEKICGLAVFCDNFVQELTSKDIVSVDKQVSNMDSFPAQQKQTSEPVSSDDSSSDMSQDIGADNNFLPDDVAGYFKCEDEVHDERTKEATSDVEGILKDIRHLRCQCTWLITSPLATEEVDRLLVHQHDNMQSSVIKVNAMLMHGEKMGMLQNYHPKTGIGKQSLQGLNKIRSNLLFVADTFSSILHFDNEKELNGSLLKKLLRDICIIERKVCTLQQRSSSNGRNQAEIGTDYLSLRREFARKNEIVEGLCFDLRLLQESNSYAQDMKDKNEEITAALIQVQRELTMKNSVIDNILEKQKMLEAQLADNEAALSTSNYELRQAQNLCSMLLKENRELHVLLEDGYSKTAQIEELLEEKNKVINGLEKQILFIRNSAQDSIRSSVEEVMSELRRISKERDHLQEEKLDMNDKLELAMSLADEKEAIAVEARQTAETAKIYAEEKEEEVKILERSVEELENTINALERKVYELKEEVGSYQLIRKDLELEVQALKKRIAMVENAGEVYVAEDLCVTGGKLQIPMKLGDLIIELHEARRYIEDLEMETRCKEEEIKEYKDHISELLMHSEAQSSLFREKFKGLEHMVFEVKADPSTSKPELDVNKIEKSIVRTRGSSSPFRCISSIVQQMNLEKDQELSKAMLRIEELEAIAANRQKEVCLLTTRLVAADIMTHDVIRDLLGVKLDMTNYASLLDQEQLQNILAKSQQQAEESKAKEMEILNLKQQIDHLLQERDSLVEEINQRKSDIISRRMIIEQLQQREQLLAAQNEMLKMDKVNLSRKIAELDEKLELLFGLKSIKDHIRQTGSTECTSQNVACEEFSKRLAQSDKLLSHARHDLSRYRNSNHKNLLD
ncbi:kinesin-like protein KIN-12E isoform X5 [Typha angustifolia]|uniref:kinesin-like protein KIN-12E isoform X5 n=1 Tax=Typha angustifolia TaxID=59011 RepID=UPI003C2ABD85